MLCCIAAALAWALYSGKVVIPPAFNPWAALEVMAPPNLLTNYKLARARNDPVLCQQALAQTGMTYDRVPDRVTGPGCGFENAVRLRKRSRHATANALDIAGFTLEDGQHITVLKNWQPEQTDKPAQMLAKVHQGACRFFNGVLGPDYHAAHRNHFHLETGGYAMCR